METQEETIRRFASVAKAEKEQGSIMLRLGTTEEGYFYLFDEHTNRVVSHQAELRTAIEMQNGGYESVSITIVTDKRMNSPDFRSTVIP